jgi:hypothetical protein
MIMGAVFLFFRRKTPVFWQLGVCIPRLLFFSNEQPLLSNDISE